MCWNSQMMPSPAPDPQVRDVALLTGFETCGIVVPNPNSVATLDCRCQTMLIRLPAISTIFPQATLSLNSCLRDKGKSVNISLILVI